MVPVEKRRGPVIRPARISSALLKTISVSFDGSSASVDLSGSLVAGGDDLDLVPGPAPLTVWQVVGLVCCTLLLSLSALVVFDVFQTVRGPQGSPVSAPLLNALTKTFGW